MKFAKGEAGGKTIQNKEPADYIMKPVLIVMAAGMGSRYGGLKQLDPIGPGGELIIDYSLYDAWRAGFETAICVIKKENYEDFKAIMDRGAAKKMNIIYAFQEMADIPEGCYIPEGRVKPWGTSHAILATRKYIDSPFAVVNADDYYGPNGFKVIFDYLSNAEDTDKINCCMVNYYIENTLTENGFVSRGICEEGEDGYLKNIEERLRIEKHGEKIEYTLDEGKTWIEIAKGTPASMNLFGFTATMIKALEKRFEPELKKIYETNPLKGEYLLPRTVGEMIQDGEATCKMLISGDKWYGVTYKEDRPGIVAAMKEKTAAGIYKENIWE